MYIVKCLHSAFMHVQQICTLSIFYYSLLIIAEHKKQTDICVNKPQIVICTMKKTSDHFLFTVESNEVDVYKLIFRLCLFTFLCIVSSVSQS